MEDHLPKEEGMAKLLGLTLNEYRILKHSPLMENQNNHGETIEFFMHISPSNSPELLQKVKIDTSNFVRFSPKQVSRFCR